VRHPPTDTAQIMEAGALHWARIPHPPAWRARRRTTGGGRPEPAAGHRPREAPALLLRCGLRRAAGGRWRIVEAARPPINYVNAVRRRPALRKSWMRAPSAQRASPSARWRSRMARRRGGFAMRDPPLQGSELVYDGFLREAEHAQTAARRGAHADIH